jgi:hypothetical protein
MSDNPQLVQQIMNEQLVGKASIGLQNMVVDIKHKYDDIEKLEKVF